MNKLLDQEEIMWRQRSWIQRINEGDKNTKFFHRIANDRRCLNYINSIKMNEIDIKDQSMLNNIFIIHYMEIFARCNGRIQANCSFLYPTQDPSSGESDARFTEEEV